jgi:hypothetical protein
MKKIGIIFALMLVSVCSSFSDTMTKDYSEVGTLAVASISQVASNFPVEGIPISDKDMIQVQGDGVAMAVALGVVGGLVGATKLCDWLGSTYNFKVEGWMRWVGGSSGAAVGTVIGAFLPDSLLSDFVSAVGKGFGEGVGKQLASQI